MRRAPGWIVLGQIALEITALVLLLRVVAPRAKPRDTVPDVPRAPFLPAFITEVVDSGSRRYRLCAANGLLFAGFYSDGRVRLATAHGKRFSGVVVAQKAVVADLSDDISFEMEIQSQGAELFVRMSGGPYDGQTLRCEQLE